MPLLFCDIFHVLLLVTALSIDAFAAGFAYGVDRIRIPLLSMGIIGGLSAGSLLIALLAGRGILAGIPAVYAHSVSCLLLFLVGLIKLFDGAIKCFIRRQTPQEKHLTFHIFDLRFLLTVYADPDKADADKGGLLSAREACSLGIALSIDSMAAGIGAGIGAGAVVLTVVLPVLLAFVMGISAIAIGEFLGNRIAEKCSLDFSWVGGLLLIVLAVLKVWQ